MGNVTIHPQGQVLVVGGDTETFYDAYDPVDGYGDAVTAGTVVDADVTFYAPDGPTRLQLTDTTGGMVVFDQVVDVRSDGTAPRIWPTPTALQLAQRALPAAPPITGTYGTDDTTILAAVVAALAAVGVVSDATEQPA